MDRKALVADNDFFFVEFLSDLLSERGYRPIKAYDGREGMEKLREESVSLMFVDIVMPKVDGPELIRFARQKYPHKPFPIVVVSGTIIEQLDDLDDIGADYYIPKGPMDNMRRQLEEFIDHTESGGNREPATGFRIGDTERLFPRKEAVELLESLKFQKAVFESMGTGALVVDKNASVIAVNTRGLELMDRKRVDVLGQHFLRSFPKEGKNEIVKTMKTVAKNPDIPARRVSCPMGGRNLGLNVASMRLDGRLQGWVLTLEEEGVSWEEPA